MWGTLDMKNETEFPFVVYDWLAMPINLVSFLSCFQLHSWAIFLLAFQSGCHHSYSFASYFEMQR